MSEELLIIGRETPFRNNLIQRLHRENYSILLARNQDEVKQLFSQKSVSIVLLNLDGVQGGLDLLRWIKSESPLTEVIILNRSSQIALSIQGMKLGAFDDFMLPIDVEALIRRIREAENKLLKNIQKPSPSL